MRPTARVAAVDSCILSGLTAWPSGCFLASVSLDRVCLFLRVPGFALGLKGNQKDHHFDHFARPPHVGWRWLEGATAPAAVDATKWFGLKGHACRINLLVA